MDNPALQQRIAAVRARASIVRVVGGAVKLSHGKRARCPFHQSNSESFAVYADTGRARCWGCGWTGDAIEFVREFYGLGFLDALARLEADFGLGEGQGTEGLLANPVHREKQVREWQPPETVESFEVAAWLWQQARPDHDAVRTWLRARKVPDHGLDERLLGEVRFVAEAPIRAWPLGKGPGDVAHAPAMVCLMRRVEEGESGRRLVASGVHVTYLSPGLTAKMNRRRSNGELLPARKMYGASAAAMVVLGAYRPDCPLYVGEGIETVLHGMALCGAGDAACGLAVLSLDNLQGKARTWKGGVLPLFDIRPDPQRRGVCFTHDGPVTGLIDADMSPLKGPFDCETGAFRGLPVVERRGGPIVRRTITSLERSEVCAALFVQNWRAAGCRRVTALRPQMGMDFDDLGRSIAA